MLFKKKEGQSVLASTKAESVSEKDTTAESNVNDIQAIQSATEIVYPSGLKLVLLMVSIFVGLFLVALVR
jgi:hypothetical protein